MAENDLPKSSTANRDGALRRFARAVRHGPDRLLHALRRARVRTRLHESSLPDAVVFVCLGNINRSAYAAAALTRELGGGDPLSIPVSSAGLIGPGRPASELARLTASARRLDLGGHVSRLLETVPVTERTLVVVMSAEQQRRAAAVLKRKRAPIIVLGDLDPRPIERRLIQDPYGRGPEVFIDVFDRIDRCVAELARALRRSAARGR